ncbi:endonuclease/exonuclease/phosphatase family protein [Halobacillus shinanisalinarum]|uniref:Endonuclease/exonuclease/phosphatase family protein n=1 Tax=Halobacillus shinanisalinarum TaxID=2932258 RepID=A0ABY4H4L2_9BACI|nr:endonuclease/exonuclease/phosphatase family protein [Halobacillus shinanisalinarum]UOQ95103.1 endonuclease/exonuclease/phosphatase family protein [Halobacillus shinanisalinarum]
MQKILFALLAVVLFASLTNSGSSVFAEKEEFSREESVNVKVMSYNIHHAEGEDGILNLERIAQVIEGTDADIIGLQEVDKHWSSRSDFQDQAKLLAERLGMFYTYAANLDYESSKEDEANRQYGTAILSRYPIIDSVNHFLPKIGNTEQRGLLEATINVKGTHLQFYNTHLALTSEERNIQIKEIIDIAGRSGGPKVIMGDLNAAPTSEEMRAMYTHYSDAFAGQNEAYTYSATNPTKRIDYIFTSKDMETKNAQVIESLASDHLPITLEITLDRSEPYYK